MLVLSVCWRGFRTPTLVAAFSEENVAQIASFSSHVLAIDVQGRAYSWGSAGARLGHNTGYAERV